MVNSRSRECGESVKQREIERVGQVGKNKRERDWVRKGVKAPGVKGVR